MTCTFCKSKKIYVSADFFKFDGTVEKIQGCKKHFEHARAKQDSVRFIDKMEMRIKTPSMFYTK